jgi:hypothetical protein
MNNIRRLTGVLVTSVALVVLSGCASIKEGSGFTVQPKSAEVVRQEPWHNVTLMGNVSAIETLAVGPFNLPEPFPLKWENELVDEGRVYPAKQVDGKVVSKPLVRVVERALLYNEDGRLLELFDAIFHPDYRMFFVNLPLERAAALRGHLVIVSSDGTWLMTGRKKMVTLPVGQDLRQLPQGFFREHPSDLRQVLTLKSPDPIISYLKWRFSETLVVNDIWYSGTKDAKTIMGKFTNLSSVADRVISCGSFTVSPGLIPVFVAISLVRNIHVATQEDCLAKKSN